jgi:FAD/FMN-containing dehydrogenase
MSRKTLYVPGDPDSAARFLAGCSRLAEAGHDVSVRIAAEAAVDQSEDRETIQDEKELDGFATEEIDVLVSFEGLSGVIELSAPDMLIRVRGGTPLCAAVAAASEAGLWFPHFDDSIEEGVSVAALLMEAPRLPVSNTYGGLREYILSVELVTAAGEKVRFGSRAVKDVAGYEVIGLLLGGGGRYGIITEVTLRLIPEPAEKIFSPGEIRKGVRPQGNGFERLAAEVQRAFDPAGILRW